MHALTLLLLAATPATGDEAGGTSARVAADNFGYHAGSIQIIVDAPPITAQTTVNAGTLPKGFVYSGQGAGTNSFSIGLGGGVGYCLTSIFELGGVVTFNFYDLTHSVAGVTSSENAFDVVIEPFAKVNLAEVIGSQRLNPFAMVGPVLGVGQVLGGASTPELGVDLELGVEYFLERHWGLAAYVPLGFLDQTTPGTTTLTIGVGFGMFGYL
jgi:hypothetical protein